MTLLFLMKYSFGIPSNSQKFDNINNQFNYSLKILCSNNDLEHVQHAFQIYCVSHGIIHQTSPHTPQQNIISKEKIIIYLILLEA